MLEREQRVSSLSFMYFILEMSPKAQQFSDVSDKRRRSA